MRIVILGYFNGDASQNGYRIAQAWERQGHSVKCLDFTMPEQEIVKNILNFAPKFVLVTMGREFNHSALSEVRHQGIFLVNWTPDEYGPNDHPGGTWFESTKGIYNLFLMQVRGLVPLLKDYADEVIWVPMYFDTLYHASTKKRGNFLQDVGFLGGINRAQSSIRVDFLKKLINDGYNIKIGGDRWVINENIPENCYAGSMLVNGDMANFYRKTKIALNFVNDKLPQYDLAVSNRIFKVIGTGGFLLTQETTGLEELLVPGKHCITYRSTDYVDLKNKIDYYLKHDSERERIVLDGEMHVRRHFNIDKITKMFLTEITNRL